MSIISTAQAARILEVSKKTLLRWDEAGKFSPTSREEISKGRVYEEKDVQNLKKLQDHETRFQNNLKELREAQNELNPYMNASEVWLTDKEIGLLDKESALIKEHEKLMKEFVSFGPEIKELYKQFYMGK